MLPLGMISPATAPIVVPTPAAANTAPERRQHLREDHRPADAVHQSTALFDERRGAAASARCCR